MAVNTKGEKEKRDQERALPTSPTFKLLHIAICKQSKTRASEAGYLMFTPVVVNAFIS